MPRTRGTAWGCTPMPRGFRKAVNADCNLTHGFDDGGVTGPSTAYWEGTIQNPPGKNKATAGLPAKAPGDPRKLRSHMDFRAPEKSTDLHFARRVFHAAPPCPTAHPPHVSASAWCHGLRSGLSGVA